jgi:hypothetical protein
MGARQRAVRDTRQALSATHRSIDAAAQRVERAWRSERGRACVARSDSNMPARRGLTAAGSVRRLLFPLCRYGTSWKQRAPWPLSLAFLPNSVRHVALHVAPCRALTHSPRAPRHNRPWRCPPPCSASSSRPSTRLTRPARCAARRGRRCPSRRRARCSCALPRAPSILPTCSPSWCELDGLPASFCAGMPASLCALGCQRGGCSLPARALGRGLQHARLRRGRASRRGA